MFAFGFFSKVSQNNLSPKLANQFLNWRINRSKFRSFYENYFRGTFCFFYYFYLQNKLLNRYLVHSEMKKNQLLIKNDQTNKPWPQIVAKENIVLLKFGIIFLIIKIKHLTTTRNIWMVLDWKHILFIYSGSITNISKYKNLLTVYTKRANRPFWNLRFYFLDIFFRYDT